MYTLVLLMLVAFVLVVLWLNSASIRRARPQPAKRPEPVPGLFPRNDPDMSYEMADELGIDPAAGEVKQTGGPDDNGTQV